MRPQVGRQNVATRRDEEGRTPKHVRPIPALTVGEHDIRVLTARGRNPPGTQGDPVGRRKADEFGVQP
jgi:hypothetical protein